MIKIGNSIKELPQLSNLPDHLFSTAQAMAEAQAMEAEEIKLCSVCREIYPCRCVAEEWRYEDGD